MLQVGTLIEGDRVCCVDGAAGFVRLTHSFLCMREI